MRLDKVGPIVEGRLSGCPGRISWRTVFQLEDAPHVLSGVAEFTACNAGTEIELADGDAVVLDVVGKVVIPLGHGSNEDCDALILAETGDIVAHTHNFRVETECDFAAIGWEVVGNGILNDLDELLLGCRGSDLMSVEQLHHQAGKSLEGTRYADCRADSDQHILRCLNIYLQLPGLVDWRVEEG